MVRVWNNDEQERKAATKFMRESSHRLPTFQKMFGLGSEEIDTVINPMALEAQEPVGSMGDDTPVAVLSRRHRSIYDYFRQSFAQVTNPPIDPLRESAVMSLETCIGREHNVFHETASHAHRVILPWPVLNYVKYQTLLGLDQRYYRNVRFSMNYDPANLKLRDALVNLAESCVGAVRGGRHHHRAQRPRHHSRQAADAGAAGRGRRAPGPAAGRRAAQRQHPHRDRLGTRRAPVRRAAGPGRHGHLPLPGVPEHQPAAGIGRAAGRPDRIAQELPPRHPQGPAENPVQDGYLHHGQLPRLPVVRSRRPGARSGRPVLPEGRLQDQGRGLRGTGDRFARGRRPGLDGAAAAGPRWPVPLHARRRGPRLQPGRRDEPAAGRGQRQVGRLPQVRGHGRTSAPPLAIRDLLDVQAGRAAAAAGQGRARRSYISRVSTPPRCPSARCRRRPTSRWPSP